MHRSHNNRGLGGGRPPLAGFPMPITPNCSKQGPNFRYEFNMRYARRCDGGYGDDESRSGVYGNRFTGSDELGMGGSLCGDMHRLKLCRSL